MALLPNWKKVAKKSWSGWLIVVATLLTGAEAVLQIYGADWLPVPQWVRLLIVMIVMAGAFVARLFTQKNLRDDSEE